MTHIQLPYASGVFLAAVAQWPDRVIAWKVDDRTVAFVGKDSDVAAPYLLDATEHDGETLNGDVLRCRLTTPDHLYDAVIPGLLSVAFPVVFVDRVELETE